eukprot:TRINITY_DN64595_c0_g1_i1.p1 TRINITY_DN64595_c0_g1~~TRINITY_DN64595_c0_g1_i1.p1  ORF type:complete len:829 (+),score=195.65 TRINITY_DN64595_c0_g1_i1:181-2667(+)
MRRAPPRSRGSGNSSAGSSAVASSSSVGGRRGGDTVGSPNARGLSAAAATAVSPSRMAMPQRQVLRDRPSRPGGERVGAPAATSPGSPEDVDGSTSEQLAMLEKRLRKIERLMGSAESTPYKDRSTKGFEQEFAEVLSGNVRSVHCDASTTSSMASSTPTSRLKLRFGEPEICEVSLPPTPCRGSTPPPTWDLAADGCSGSPPALAPPATPGVAAAAAKAAEAAVTLMGEEIQSLPPVLKTALPATLATWRRRQLHILALGQSADRRSGSNSPQRGGRAGSHSPPPPARCGSPVRVANAVARDAVSPTRDVASRSRDCSPVAPVGARSRNLAAGAASASAGSPGRRAAASSAAAAPAASSSPPPPRKRAAAQTVLPTGSVAQASVGGDAHAPAVSSRAAAGASAAAASAARGPAGERQSCTTDADAAGMLPTPRGPPVTLAPAGWEDAPSAWKSVEDDYFAERPPESARRASPPSQPPAPAAAPPSPANAEYPALPSRDDLQQWGEAEVTTWLSGLAARSSIDASTVESEDHDSGLSCSLARVVIEHAISGRVLLSLSEADLLHLNIAQPHRGVIARGARELQAAFGVPSSSSAQDEDCSQSGGTRGSPRERPSFAGPWGGSTAGAAGTRGGRSPSGGGGGRRTPGAGGGCGGWRRSSPASSAAKPTSRAARASASSAAAVASCSSAPASAAAPAGGAWRAPAAAWGPASAASAAAAAAVAAAAAAARSFDASRATGSAASASWPAPLPPPPPRPTLRSRSPTGAASAVASAAATATAAVAVGGDAASGSDDAVAGVAAALSGRPAAVPVRGCRSSLSPQPAAARWRR